MARKKNITKEQLITMYMAYVMEHNDNPNSVFKFSKDNNFEESDFYKFFSSFDHLENSIFTEFYSVTINLLHKSEDFEHYDARNKLLSFYFTFFEVLTANRSYVVYALKAKKLNFSKLKTMSGLRTSFISFIETLDIETLDIKQERLEKLQQKTINESAWAQLLLTLKFWLDDTSPSFEKTDIFIEKSVNASFDIMNITPIKSVIDFGKFLFKEKIKTTS